MRSTRSVALGCAAIALTVCALAVVGSIAYRDWKITTLVRMSASEPMAKLARETDPSFSFVNPEAHYDGVYFYAIARDPLARGEAHTLIDRAAYRYGHAGYGWLAWLVSAGQPRLVPAALLALGLAGAAVAAFAAAVLAAALGRSPWWGLVAALSPGVIYSVTADVSEPVAVAVVLLALLAWHRRRWSWAGVGLAAGCLIKEPLLLVPIGLGVWELAWWLRGKRLADFAQRVIAVTAGPVVFGVWYLYLERQFGVFPYRQGRDLLGAPITGWIDTFHRASTMAVDSFDRMQIGTAITTFLAIVAVLFVLGLVRALRFRWWLDSVFVLFAILVSLFGWLELLYPKDLVRELAIPLVFLPAVLAGPGDTRDDASAVTFDQPRQPSD
jgi:hypothetical protein